jgi:hypothetical protein
MNIKKGIPVKDINSAIKWSYQFFSDHMDLISFTHHVKHSTNWEISAMLIDDNNAIVGAYLLGDLQLPAMIKNEASDKYEGLKGVEGVLLVIEPSIRSKGWGNKLKYYPKTLGVDYIWGQQLKSLNNLEDWLKRRELIGVSEDIYITAELF